MGAVPGLPGPVRSRKGSKMSIELREICCDTCPLNPTCEEENQFLQDIGLADPWGEEHEIPTHWDEIGNAEETWWGEE